MPPQLPAQYRDAGAERKDRDGRRREDRSAQRWTGQLGDASPTKERDHELEVEPGRQARAPFAPIPMAASQDTQSRTAAEVAGVRRPRSIGWP
jgi:hypothetical protein